jgi:hypothetical protein
MQCHPIRAVEASGAKYSAVQSNVFTEIGKRGPRYLIADTAPFVPLAYGRNRRQENVNKKQSANRP